MTCRRAINQFQKSDDCGAHFRRALILGEHRIEEALSRFVFHTLKPFNATSRKPTKPSSFQGPAGAIGVQSGTPTLERPPILQDRGALNQVNDSSVLHATQHGENGCDVIHTARGSKIWA